MDSEENIPNTFAIPEVAHNDMYEESDRIRKNSEVFDYSEDDHNQYSRHDQTSEDEKPNIKQKGNIWNHLLL